MDNKEFYTLLVHLLDDDTMRYHIAFSNNVIICLLIGRHLTKEELDYIYYNWRAFYSEPYRYSNWKDIIKDSLNDLENIRKESE